MIHRLVNAILYFLSGFVPRDRNKVLFGAWMGRRFADNPKYLVRYLATDTTALALVWCGHEEVRISVAGEEGVRFVRYGTLAAVRESLTCGNCFVSHGYRDVGPYNLLRGARLTYLGHGLAIKRMGSDDRPMSSAFLTRVRSLFRYAESYSYYIATSEEHRRKLMKENAVSNVTPERILDVGQPRTDFLIHAARTMVASESRRRFLAKQLLRPTTYLVSYLPTFRDKEMKVFSFAGLQGEQRAKLERLLADLDAVLVEKTHFRDAHLNSATVHGPATRVVGIPESHVDTQELLLATDLLVTDYSGCYLDYLILDRPVVHFAYDREYYLNADRGLYFDLSEVAGGEVVEHFEALLRSLERNLRLPGLECERRARVRARLMEYEAGTSCRELARMILATTPNATPSSGPARNTL